MKLPGPTAGAPERHNAALVRILIFHGFLLRGTGSNVYNASLVAAAAGDADGEEDEQQRAEARDQRSMAGSRRPQCGQSLRSFWTSCSSEHPHRRRFSTE